MQLAEMISIMSGFGIETKDTSWVNIQQVIELLQKQAARIAELEAERHYLQWFHMAADFGPADYDVIVAMQEQYEKVSGKPVPEDWRYKDEE